MYPLSKTLMSASLAMGLNAANAQEMPLEDIDRFQAVTGLTLTYFIVTDEGYVSKFCTQERGCVRVSTNYSAENFLCTMFHAQSYDFTPQELPDLYRRELQLCRDKGLIP